MWRSRVALASIRFTPLAMTQNRPEEFELHRLDPSAQDEREDDFERRQFANVVALFAVVAIVLLAYWAFDALEHSRGLQRCLDSGRSNCVDFVSPPGGK